MRHHLRACLLILALLNISLLVRAQANPWREFKDAFVLERDGKPAQAIIALQLLVSSKSLDAVIVGKSWDVLGLAYEDQGSFSRAQHAFEQAIHVLKALPDHATDYAMALDDLGGLYLAMDQIDASRNLKLQALRLYAEADEHGGIAISCSDLAALALVKNKIHDAKKYLARARDEQLAATDLDDDGRAAISSMQGWLARIDGKIPDAVFAYQHSLDLWRNQHGEEHSFTGWGYMLLGNAKAEAGESASGLVDMERGLRIIGRTLGHENPRYLWGEIAYARVLDQTGAHPPAARIKAEAERQLKDLYRGQCPGCTISVAAFR